MEEIFTPEQQKGMDIFKTANFESGVFINDGKGNFQFRPFPELAQLSTINDIVTADFNGDGIPDILAGGNSEDADVATGNYDATAAILLIGHTDGTLTAMKATAGLSMKGEVRRIIYIKEKNTVVFLKNNAAAQVMQKQ
jgi:hypothetical protein